MKGQKPAPTIPILVEPSWLIVIATQKFLSCGFSISGAILSSFSLLNCTYSAHSLALSGQIASHPSVPTCPSKEEQMSATAPMSIKIGLGEAWVWIRHLWMPFGRAKASLIEANEKRVNERI